MTNKVAFLWILCFVLSLTLQAQAKKYAFGDSIYVWASSLNMRESPSQKAKIVGKVPYGSAVVIGDLEMRKTPYKYKALEASTLEGTNKTKPFYLNGFWVKVEYDSTLGYIFDGYLSKLKPKPAGTDKFELLKTWAKRDLKLKPEKLKESESEWTEYIGKPDLIRVSIGHDSKTSFREVKLKNTSFEEACMLGISIFHGSYLMEAAENKVVFKSTDDNGDCEIWITKKGSWVVISLSCSC